MKEERRSEWAERHAWGEGRGVRYGELARRRQRGSFLSNTKSAERVKGRKSNTIQT